MAPSSGSRRRVARVVVVLGHGLLVLLVLSESVDTVAFAPVGTPLQVLFLEPPPPARPPASRERVPDVDPRRRPRDPRDPRALPPESTAITPDAGPPGEPPRAVDWYGEAARVAGATAPPAARAERCSDHERPGSMLPRCTPRRRSFEWRPEPKAVEFSGGLPYVHLGKRCVVGLGFFGCAVGTIPPANGQLFDALQDPERPRGSVPDDPH